MDWKTENLVTDSPYAVKTFITHYIRQKFFITPRVYVLSGKEEFALNVETGWGDRIISLSLSNQKKKSIDLSSINVGTDYRGHGAGAMALKIALGVAFARGVDHLFITTINNDGFSFWPRMGSLPHIGFGQEVDFGYRMSRWLSLFKVYNNAVLDSAARDEITSLELLAQRYPFRAWRRLSQSDTKFKDGSKINRRIFCQALFEGDHILILGDFGTQKILRKRLGIIPSFRYDSTCFILARRIDTISVRLCEHCLRKRSFTFD